MAGGGRKARAAALFSIATGLSRLVGLLREVLVAYVFGVCGAINQFTVASQIPNVVRSLVADAALGAAFIPVFNELLEKGEDGGHGASRRRSRRSRSSASPRSRRSTMLFAEPLLGIFYDGPGAAPDGAADVDPDADRGAARVRRASCRRS